MSKASKNNLSSGRIRVISGVFAIPLHERTAAASGSPAPVRDAATARVSQFIAGPENSLVRIVAESLLSKSSSFNPIVLYGPTGVGKTALVQTLLAERGNLSLPSAALFLSGADFARAYANAVETDSIGDLRDRYDRCDLLAIDDLHRLATKPAAQQELLHVIDRLLDRGALFVATLRDLPHDTAHLLPGLVSRLSAGLLVPLVAPQVAARQMIIEQVASSYDVALPAALVGRLANPPASVRAAFATAPQLRQAVLQLANRSQNRQLPIDAALLDELTAEHAPDAKAAMRQITATVAKQFCLPVGELRGQTRKQAVVQARGIAMHLCRRLTGSSFAVIGRAFGGRDHTTVLHACRRIEGLLESDPATCRMVEDLLAHFVNCPFATAAEEA